MIIDGVCMLRGVTTPAQCTIIQLTDITEHYTAHSNRMHKRPGMPLCLKHSMETSHGTENILATAKFSHKKQFRFRGFGQR